MNRIDLTDQELHVLLALLRNLQGAQKAWLGPSLTGIRQKLEAALVTEPEGHPLNAHQHYIAAPCLACAEPTESELREVWGGR